MARHVMISGLPATGKTTGMRFLNPDTTVYLDVDGKGLSWGGWKKQYNTDKGNYFRVNDAATVYKYIKGIHDKKSEIKTIVVDTISTLMSNAEMEILKNPSRDQWADLATDIYDLFKLIRDLEREDITVVCVSHIEPYDVNGVVHFRIKTNGKKLTKLNLNSFLTYNLYTHVEYNVGEQPTYSLITQSDGTTEARAMMGIFEPMIENNIERVIQTIIEKEQ